MIDQWAGRLEDLKSLVRDSPNPNQRRPSLKNDLEVLDSGLTELLHTNAGVMKHAVNLPQPTELTAAIQLLNYAPADDPLVQELMEDAKQNPTHRGKIPKKSSCPTFASKTLPKFCLGNREDLSQEDLNALQDHILVLDYNCLVVEKGKHDTDLGRRRHCQR